MTQRASPQNKAGRGRPCYHAGLAIHGARQRSCDEPNAGRLASARQRRTVNRELPTDLNDDGHGYARADYESDPVLAVTSANWTALVCLSTAARGGSSCQPARLSADFHKYGGIRPPMHPAPRRCSSVEYSRYAPSSRLAGRAPRRPSVPHRIYERQHLVPSSAHRIPHWRASKPEARLYLRG